MSQSTRIFGSMIAVCSIGGTSFLLSCKNFGIDWTYDTQEAVALKDVSHYPIGIRDGWVGTGDFYVNTSNTSGEGGPGATLWTKALAKAQVAVAYTDNAITGGGNALTGSAIITKINEKSDDGAVVCSVTLTGQGALSSSIS